MKTVCIVGAGPAGLVAAKTFLQAGQFRVSVYEKKTRLGGIWAIDEDTVDGWLSPYTPTNLSRFTVGFADLDWNSVDLRSRYDKQLETNDDQKRAPPMFPKAWHVNQYLECYKKRFIPEGLIKFSSRVVNAERVRKSDSDSHWKVTIDTGSSDAEVRTFDYLLVASGFFAQPRLLEQNVPRLASDASGSSISVIHSSQFRDLKDLFPRETEASGKDILLLGGGNSSGETAAAIAMQLSNSQWSPNKTRQKAYQGCKIVHVTPRPIYALPPYLQREKDSFTFAPLDLKFYDLSKRPQGMESFAGQQIKEVRDIAHNRIQTMIGGDQRDLGCEALVSAEGEKRGSSYVALTEFYPEFVRSGLIDVVGGRVIGLNSTGFDDASVTIKCGDHEERLHNIGAIVYATGFTPLPAFDFLADEVKAALQQDPQSLRLPLVLEQWQTYNAAVPTLSFLGFYEGPYWPMIEMQAKMTVQRWLKNDLSPTKPFEEANKLLALRQAMQDRSLDVPQFWFSDYVGYMEDVAAHLGLQRNDGPFGGNEGCLSPARYLHKHSDYSESDAIMQDLHKVWHECVDHGKYVPRAVFRAMHGKWRINRRVESSDPAFSGTLDGEASFHLRFPTKDKSDELFDLEYLYVESGTFHSSGGMTMMASRRYVYRYSEARDELSVWFVKPDSPLEVDYLFHNLNFVSPAEARNAGACIAKADHLCVDDMYWTEYKMPIKGIALHDFQIKHTVKGPNKDYIATTRYSRPQNNHSNGEI